MKLHINGEHIYLLWTLLLSMDSENREKVQPNYETLANRKNTKVYHSILNLNHKLAYEKGIWFQELDLKIFATIKDDSCCKTTYLYVNDVKQLTENFIIWKSLYNHKSDIEIRVLNFLEFLSPVFAFYLLLAWRGLNERYNSIKCIVANKIRKVLDVFAKILIRSFFILLMKEMYHLRNFIYCVIWKFLHKQFQCKRTILLFLTLIQVINASNATIPAPFASKSISHFNLNNSYIKPNTSYSTNENDYELNINWAGDEINTPLKKNFDNYAFAKELTTTVSDAYINKMDILEKSLAAVLIKVAYGTTSTTKRSISDNSHMLTTAATPSLTTVRYHQKLPQQIRVDLHYRNYELDLERDHALPTSAPNADILKSNSNKLYPNPNLRQNTDFDKYRHLINTSLIPSFNILKQTNTQIPTMPTSDSIPSYLPPVRSFFTPPLPPEYQHPFADKPTLRGTHSDTGVVSNSGSFIHRRPIPPPSLMPGHERVPQRPLELLIPFNDNGRISTSSPPSIGVTSISTLTSFFPDISTEPKNNLSSVVYTNDNIALKYRAKFKLDSLDKSLTTSNVDKLHINNDNLQKQILPGIKRILSGSNGRKGNVPEILLRHVTFRPVITHHNFSSPAILLTNNIFNTSVMQSGHDNSMLNISNINQAKNRVKSLMNEFANNGNIVDYRTQLHLHPLGEHILMDVMSTTTIPSVAVFESNNALDVTSSSTLISTVTVGNFSQADVINSNINSSSPYNVSSTTSNVWNLAWKTHVYFSAICFTILAVYSIYEMITFNKLTHLVTQSYFFSIHFILITICSTRIFYLLYDAYNIHSSFHVFISEICLNLPSLLLTISFSALILFLSLKSLNYKSNRYSALMRPLTVIIGSSVHILLCITLHYVESYTVQNYQQQFLRRRQMYQQHLVEQIPFQYSSINDDVHAATKLISPLSHRQSRLYTNLIVVPLPHRVLSLISRIIYIFVCFTLGLLYLYIYRILKRILMSKSQNYIHCYQNLSYAIHITIATALLFILLATLQIFGTVAVSTFWPLITQNNSEVDWLQWGYQFSMRLVEIAIITLLTWVTGLKTCSKGVVNINMSLETGNDGIIVGSTSNNEFHSVNSPFYTVKHDYNNPRTVFSPCNTTTNENHFENGCEHKANANSHTYTLRTGKLIYGKKLVRIPMANAKNSTMFKHLAYNNENDLEHTAIRCDAPKCESRDQRDLHVYTGGGAYYKSSNFIIFGSNVESCGISINGNENRNTNEERIVSNFQKHSATSTPATHTMESASNCNFSSYIPKNLHNQMFLTDGNDCNIETTPTSDKEDFEKVKCYTSHQQRLRQFLDNSSLNKQVHTTLYKVGATKTHKTSDKFSIN